MSSSSRRGVRAGLIVRPPSTAGGFAREVAGDDRGNLIPEAYAVVGATVLRIDLGRVGQVEPGQTGAMIGNPLAVVEGMIGWADRSRKTQDCSIQERLNSGLIRFQERHVRIDSSSSGIVKYGWSGSRYFEGRRTVFRRTPRARQVGVLDDPRKWKIVVRDIEPVDIGQGMAQLQEGHDRCLVLQPAEFLSIRSGRSGTARQAPVMAS